MASAAAFVDTTTEAAESPSGIGGLLSVAAETLFQKPTGTVADLSCDKEVSLGPQTLAEVDGRPRDDDDECSVGGQPESENNSAQPEVSATTLPQSSLDSNTSENHKKTDIALSSENAHHLPDVMATIDEAALAQPLIQILPLSSVSDASSATAPHEENHVEVMIVDATTASETGSQDLTISTVQDALAAAVNELNDQQSGEEQLGVEGQVFITADTATVEGTAVEVVNASSSEHEQVDEQQQPIMIIVDPSSSIGVDDEGIVDEEGIATTMVVDENEQVIQMEQEGAVQIISVDASGVGSTVDNTYVSLKPKADYLANNLI